VSAAGHPYALRSPWYVREREHLTPFDQAARRPAIQKYATSDFVDRLVADPRDSLRFDADDRWSFPVPVGAFPKTASGRQRFATHRMLHTTMRKLYQPSHERFYALTVELFCDQAGLPRPGDVPGLEVGLVVRRERMRFLGPHWAVRQLARSLVRELAQQAHVSRGGPRVPDPDDLDDVVWVEQAEHHAFTSAQRRLLEQIQPRRVVEAWVVTSAGRGSWRKVDLDAPPSLLPGEQEMPMWRLPARDEDCPAAHTRSLWFGVVPTYSADLDEVGFPKLDDRSIYRIRCFARRRPAPGHERCPPELWWSEPTVPFRLAPFFDPSGTKNRRVSVTMPDFRALAARAGEPQGPGGVELVRPPGSQMKFDPNKGTPGNADQDLGSATSRCTFALELFMIVAMFVFSLFLPIVMLLFNLWWLLLLRFCWPRDEQALQAVAGHTIASLDANGEAMLDRLLDAKGTAAALKGVATLKDDQELAATVVASVQPTAPPVAPDPTPEDKPGDPLCAGS
jgi:hypothetical protein